MSREPETIGRYRVQRSLGAGAMGAVYLAEDPLLKRPIAIKVVQAVGVSADQARARFRREAEISARLNHPNVITIYDVGEDAQWGPFLAMEYVDGQSLTELIRAGGLDDAARMRILAFAMQGLEAAHAAGVVHRDIKPSNVMVGRDGRVKLMDFGIARGEDTGLTATGAVLGTPAYMAPEQLKGVAPSVTTDRYAFAVMAFELFTGDRPFQAETASAMFYTIVNSPPRIPEGMPPALASAFCRALAKHPAERPPTLGAFLAEILAGASIDPGARVRLAGLAGLTEPDTGAPKERGRPAVGAVARTTIVAPTPLTPASLAPGLSAGKLLGIGGGVVALTGVLAGLVLWPRGGANTSAHVELADVAPSRSLASAAPTVPVVPTTPPRLPTPQVAPTLADAPTLPPAPTIPPQPTPNASLEAPVLTLARVEREPEPPPLPTIPPLTSRELEDKIKRELRRRDLTHVVVRIDKERRVRLGNLVDRSEEREARSAVAAAAPDLQIVSADIRRPPEPTATPGWGVIHGEGAERSD